MYHDTRTPEQLKDWKCKQCDKDCFIDDKDYFMVTDELWAKYGVGLDMLCMDCMESRIGHKLTIDDIKFNELTEDMNPYTKAIIQAQNNG